MKCLLSAALSGLLTLPAFTTEELPESLAPFLAHAETEHGDFGKRAALHLLEHMPASDLKELDSKLLRPRQLHPTRVLIRLRRTPTFFIHLS